MTTAAARSRPNFRYSVVPGGAVDRKELAGKLQTDRVAASHYRNVNVAKLEPVRLSEPRRAYVSYRLQEKVYWTSKPVQLQEGELVLTGDGETVRARCGNRVSATPQLPIAKQEPPLAELDVPEFESGGPLAPDNIRFRELTWPGAPATEVAKLPLVIGQQPGVEGIAAYAGLVGYSPGPMLGVPPTAGGSGGSGGAGSAPIGLGPPSEDAAPPSGNGNGSGSGSGPGTPPPGGGSGGSGGGSAPATAEPPNGSSPGGGGDPLSPPPGPANPSPLGPPPGGNPKTPNPLAPPSPFPPADPPGPPTTELPPYSPPPTTIPPPLPPPPTIPPKQEPPDPMAPVPEPATVGWIAASLAAMAALRLRRPR